MERTEFEQLLRAAVHDLREPLRMVRAYTELLQRRYRDALDADGNEFLVYAADGARRMEGVVDDFVGFVEIWSRPPELEACDTAACAAEAIASLGPALEAAGASVDVRALPRLRADPARMTLLFRELLDNAVKFRSDKPPRILLDASRDGDAWHFVLQDNGIGVDERGRERALQPFQRLHPIGRYQGSGLGLAKCREIVSSHGGRIWIDGAPGGGTAVHFTVPLPGPHEEGPA